MPVIAVNLAAALFSKVTELVDHGLYASPEQFLEIAVFNQLALERGSRPEDLVAQVSPPRLAEKATSKRLARRKPKRSRRHSAQELSSRSSPIARVSGRRGVSKKEVGETLKRLALSRAHEAVPEPVPIAVRPATERLWGQVNRLFPLKFGCRWILVANAGRRDWQRYDAISDQLADDAATLGSHLEAADTLLGRQRDDLLSRGLPRRGNSASRDRFLSQFIARTTRSAEIYPGAICQYALAAFDGDHLALTERGIELARLPNPVLDTNSDDATATLSDSERAFFVEQVLQYAPGEVRDLGTVLKAVLAGQVTPDDMFDAVRTQFPAEWTDVMARTHVSGLVARLGEMALLRRRWAGRNVSYEPAVRATELVGLLER